MTQTLGYSTFSCTKCIFICRAEEELAQCWSSWTLFKPKSTPRLPSFTNWKCLKTTSRESAAWMESAFSTTLFRFSAEKKRPYTLTSPTGLRFCCHPVEQLSPFYLQLLQLFSCYTGFMRGPLVDVIVSRRILESLFLTRTVHLFPGARRKSRDHLEVQRKLKIPRIPLPLDNQPLRTDPGPTHHPSRCSAGSGWHGR